MIFEQEGLDTASKRDVVWQSLKYASYCFDLVKEDIREIFQAYLDVGEDRRIAANFRKEVTSTALWLIEHKIKVTPYELDSQITLDTEQIIPITDAEEYLIKVAKKKQEEIKTKEQKQAIVPVRREFWSVLLAAMNEKTTLFLC